VRGERRQQLTRRSERGVIKSEGKVVLRHGTPMGLKVGARQTKGRSTSGHLRCTYKWTRDC
jgi:hypothetical protein